MPVIAHNLTKDEQYQFDDATTPLWAVCYAYCEENNLMSALFASAQRGAFVEFSQTLPVAQGKFSIACGDWACITIKETP